MSSCWRTQFVAKCYPALCTACFATFVSVAPVDNLEWGEIYAIAGSYNISAAKSE